MHYLRLEGQERTVSRLVSCFTRVTAHILEPFPEFLGSHRLTHTKVKENKATSEVQAAQNPTALPDR